MGNCLNCHDCKKKSFVFFKCKKQKQENVTYYTVPEYVGQNVTDVYKKISELYPDYRIINLSNKSTADLLSKNQVVFIYHDSGTDDIVSRVEIY